MVLSSFLSDLCHPVFTWTFICHAVLHFSRKPYALLKSLLKEDEKWQTIELGELETWFLIASWFSFLVVPSQLHIWSTERRVLLLALTACAISSLTFGLFFSCRLLRIVSSLSNGFAQGAVIPILIKLLARTLPRSSLGNVLSLWSTSAQFGYIAAVGLTLQVVMVAASPQIALTLAGVVQSLIIPLLNWKLPSSESGFPFAVSDGMFSPHEDCSGLQIPQDSSCRSPPFNEDPLASIQLCEKARPLGEQEINQTIGLKSRNDMDEWSSENQTIIACKPLHGGKQRPFEVASPPTEWAALTAVDNVIAVDSGCSLWHEQDSRRKRDFFWSTLLSVGRATGFIPLAISFMCAKAVRNSLNFWLPLILAESTNDGVVTSGYISVIFDIGGIFGSIFGTCICSKLLRGRRFSAAFLGCIATALALPLYYHASAMHTFLAFPLLWVLGVAVAGPDNILGPSGAEGVCALNCLTLRQLGVALGMIECLGTAGSIAQSLLPVVLFGEAEQENKLQWGLLFYALSFIAFVGAVAVLTLVRTEIAAEPSFSIVPNASPKE